MLLWLLYISSRARLFLQGIDGFDKDLRGIIQFVYTVREVLA